MISVILAAKHKFAPPPPQPKISAQTLCCFFFVFFVRYFYNFVSHAHWHLQSVSVTGRKNQKTKNPICHSHLCLHFDEQKKGTISLFFFFFQSLKRSDSTVNWGEYLSHVFSSELLLFQEFSRDKFFFFSSQWNMLDPRNSRHTKKETKPTRSEW